MLQQARGQELIVESCQGSDRGVPVVSLNSIVEREKNLQVLHLMPADDSGMHGVCGVSSRISQVRHVVLVEWLSICCQDC